MTSITLPVGGMHDTFNFNGNFDKIAISGHVCGSNTINFDHIDFANIAAVEAHATHDAHANTLDATRQSR